MNSHHILQVAGSLTFTTLLALVPLLTVALTMVSALPMFSEYGLRFKAMLFALLVPHFADKVITVYMQQFADNAAQLTAAGIMMLVVTSLMLMATIERTFNFIWAAKRTRPWWQQGLIYWGMLTLGPIVLGGSRLLGHQVFNLSQLDVVGMLPISLLEASSTVLFTGVGLCLLYRLVPDRFVPLRDAVWGAGATSLLLELAKAAFGLYLDNVASYQLIYGAFASLPVFLLWIYFLWLLVLGGAVLTASMSYWATDAWRYGIKPSRYLLVAVQVLIELDTAQVSGKALTEAALHSSVSVGFDELGRVLEQLSDGYIQRGQDDRWVLMKKLSTISLSELFRLFVYQPDPSGNSTISRAIEAELAPMLRSLDAVSLNDFAQRLK